MSTNNTMNRFIYPVYNYCILCITINDILISQGYVPIAQKDCDTKIKLYLH